MKLQSARLNEIVLQQRERFLKLQQREQWLVGVGAIVVTITVLYLAIWEPIAGAHTHRAEGLVAQRALAERLEAAAAELQSMRGNGNATVDRSTSVLSAIDQSSKQGPVGKAPDRMQPEGDKEVKVWFEDVPFDALLRWLVILQTRYGVSVQTLEVERQPAVGRVNARMTLVRS